MIDIGSLTVDRCDSDELLSAKWGVVGFGARLRELRSEHELTQADLANLLGFPQGHHGKPISRLEAGETEPGLNVLAQLQAEFPADFLWLLTGLGR